MADARRRRITLSGLLYGMLTFLLGVTAVASRWERDAAVRERRAALGRAEVRVEALVSLEARLAEKQREIAAVRGELRECEELLAFMKAHGLDMRLLRERPPPIAGEVTAVSQRTLRGRGVVRVDVGAEHGVRPGLMLYAYRGAGEKAPFVGRLRVENVTPDRAFCRVLFGPLHVKPGDAVTTWLR